jgi:hypothetical protein
MKNNFVRFEYLFQKFTERNCSVSERVEFLEMVKHKNYAHVLKDLIREEIEITEIHHKIEEKKADEIFNKIIRIANADKAGDFYSIKNYSLMRWVAAAAVLIAIAGGAYLFSNQKDTKAIAKIAEKSKPVANDLAPGHAGAILTLSNGKTIILDSAHNGLLANQGNTNIVKENDRVSYDGNNKAADEIMYNTMTTPKGRQFQLVLSDGSEVWLNAASSITFPTAFDSKERKVEITGEAYFEIKPVFVSKSTMEKVPFTVVINSPSGEKSEIQVLGTHFNVNAYNNEEAIKTTLLEGSVKVTDNNSSVMIKPGQQAVLDRQKDKISVSNADVEQAVAWKNGYFSFKNATIETIMRQVERWYDVNVEYIGKKPEGHYRGEVPMNVNASEMLKVLEVSGIHFKIDGKKILID